MSFKEDSKKEVTFFFFFYFFTMELLEAGFLSPVNLEKVESGKWKNWSEVISQLMTNKPKPFSELNIQLIFQHIPF